MAPPPEYLEPTFGQRILARLLDGLIVFVPVVLIAVATGGLRPLVGLVVSAAYEITLVGRDGQTIGKRVLGIRVVDAETGALPTIDQAFRRWLAAGGVGWVLSVFVPVVSIAYDLVILVMVVRPPLHRGPYDLAARTIVTKVH